MKTPHVLAGATATAIAALFLVLPLVTNASPNTTWTVDNGASADKCTVAKPNCATIQKAIDASSNGDTINVNAGTYLAGFKVVGKTNLTIIGNGNGMGANATIIEPSSLVSTGVSHKYTANMQVSVFVNNSSGVTIKGMRIEGNLQSPDNGGPDALLFWNNSSGTLQNLAVAGNYVINGDQTGQGIAVDGGTTDLTIKGTDISGFQKNGIDIEDGNCTGFGSCTSLPGSVAVSIQNGSITGAGPTSVIAQNGVVAWNEGGGTVTANVNGTDISHLKYTGGGDSADGILAYDAGNLPSISNVTFENVQQYIGQQSFYQPSSGTPIDATNGNVFDGVAPGTATPSQLATIENKLNGEMEMGSSNPIFILPHTWIVTTKNLGIQKAINFASKNDTVLVTPGTYTGTDNVKKSLLVEGSNFNIDPNTATRDVESILDGSFTVTANNVTIDGFTIDPSSGSSIAMQGNYSGEAVQNNIITDNGYAVNFNTADTSISDNEVTYGPSFTTGVEANSNPGSNLTFNGNAFNGNGSNSPADITVIGNAGPQTANVMVSGNQSTSGTTLIALFNTSSSTVSNNTASGATNSSVIYIGGNDTGVTVTANNVSTSNNAVKVANDFSDGPNSNVTVDDNQLANDTNGVSVEAGAYTGSSVNAENNWWGDMTGPADTIGGDGSIPDMNSPGLGSTALGAVDYSNWCTDATCASFTNGTSVSTPTLLGWNIQSQASGLESDPISLACTPTGVSVDESMNSLNQRWSTVTGTDVKYIRRVSSDGGATWTVLSGSVFTGGSMGAWSSFDPTDQGKTFDTEVEAFQDFNGNNQPDDGPLTVSGWSNDCQITYTGTVPVTPLPAPTPVSPADGTVTTTAGLTSVDWSDVTDVFPPISYFYEASNASTTNPDGSFTTHVYQSGALSSSSINTPGTPDGTYFWHVYAQDNNGNKSPWSVTQSFTVNNTPTVTTDAATGVTDTNGTLNGTDGAINGDDTSFWWGTTNAGPFTASSNPGSEFPAGWNHDSGLGTVSANGQFNEAFTTLTPGTTYYFVAWVEVGGTWYPGSVLMFSTTGSAPTPSVTTDTATGVDMTDGTLNGQNGAIAADNTSFWWGTTNAGPFTSGTNPGATELPAGWSHDSGLGAAGVNGSFDEPLSGLTPGTTYYFAAWSEVGGTWYPGAVESFMTAPPANVDTDAATNVTSSDAQLNGDIGPNDAQGHSFWVSTASFATSSPSIPGGVYSTPDMGAISANSDFNATLSSITSDGVPGDLPAIQPNTTYYYVAWANVGGTWYPGAELNFTTGAVVTTPGVTTNPATNVADNDATMNATNGGVDADAESFWVSTSSIDASDPNNIPVGVYSTPVLGPVTANTDFQDQLSLVTTNGIITGGVDQNMATITPSTTYYFVAWSNVGGTWYNGGQQTVTTSATPPLAAPTANDQSVTAGENQPLAITLTATGAGSLDYSVIDSPDEGVLSGTAPNLTYTPDAGFTGSDSFTFVANNGSDSNTATVSITVVPPPTLVLNGLSPSYVQTGATYSDLGAAIATTSPASDDNLDVFASVDGGATTSSPTIDTTSAGTHTILYSATDTFGNEGTTSRSVIVLDPPTVALTSTSATNTTISDNPIPVTATFSEPVQSFSSADASTTNGVISNVQLSGDGMSATFDVTPDGNGTVTVEVVPGVVANLAGGTNTDDQQISFTYAAATQNNNSNNSNGGGSGGSNGAPQQTFSPFDLNHDGKVNLLDLNILFENWGKTGTSVPGDFNGDGVVNLLDLNLFLTQWIG